MFSRILFPVDFSNRCEGSAHAVRAMAVQFQSEVTVLHVMEVASANSEYETLVARAREKMDRFVARELRDCLVAPYFERGDPAQMILSYMRNGHFDLIMMPTHGYGPFRRFLLGSVTAKTLYDAPCPVWTAAHLETSPASGKLGIQNVLAAVDFGAHSSAVLQVASQIAESFHARLTAAHVVPISGPFMDSYWIESWREEAREGIPEQIQKLLPGRSPLTETEVLEGSPAAALSAAAERLDADLLVIGRSHHPEPGGKLGNNAYAIIARSLCPVLSI
jgi:nucleotide-binding universal stress UspA family protein